MLGLILETATEKGCIALVKEKFIFATTSLSGGPLLSDHLALETKNLLEKEKVVPDFIAVGKGPGSYTGIRVGAALAQALAFGLNIPFLSFYNLLSFSLEGAATLFDARSGGFYFLPDRKSQPILLPLESCENALSLYAKIASPHPDLIAKRLPFLKEKLIETSPDFSYLSHVLLEEFETLSHEPFSLHY